MSSPHTPHPTPRWLTALAMSLVLVVVLSSFALSFTVLRDLAALSGIPGSVAWLWPVIVDGTITAATVVLYSARGTGRSRRMPMAMLILFGLASVVGNVAHILLVDPSQVVPAGIAVFAGIIPPLGLIATVEMLGSLLRTNDKVVTEPDVAQVPTTDGSVVEPMQDGETVREPVTQVVPADEPALHHSEPELNSSSHQIETEPDLHDEPVLPSESAPVEPEPAHYDEPAETSMSDVDGPAMNTTTSDMGQPTDSVENTVVQEPESESVPVDQKPEPLDEPVRPQADPDTDHRANVVNQARELIANGASQRAAAEELGVSRATLSRWIKAAEQAEKEVEPMGVVTQLHAVNR